VVGQTSPPSPLQGLLCDRGCSARASPPRGRPSQGLRTSRSAPADVAASSVRRPLHAVSTAARCSIDRHAERSEDRPAASTGFAALSGFGPRRPPRSCRTGSPLLGFGSPSATSTGGSRSSRACLTRHGPPSGFLTPSTVCSPSGLASSRRPLPLLGFRLEEPFRAGRPWCVATPAAPPRLRCVPSPNSEEYEVGSSFASEALEPARPGSMAMVPGLPSPPSEPMIPGPSQRLSPPLVPSRAFVLGAAANRDDSDRRPRVFHQPGNRRIYWRPAAPLGFLRHSEDVLAPSGARLRWAPACPSELEVEGGSRPPPAARPGCPGRVAPPCHRTIKEPSFSGRSSAADFSGFPHHDSANRSRSHAFMRFASHLPVFRRQNSWRSLEDLRPGITA
jgi:hypothetical protein